MPKFTEEELHQLIYEDDETTGYAVVSQRTTSTDREKNSSDVEYVIEEITTGKFFKAILIDSVWVGQDEYNASQTWKEVKRKQKITYYYE